MDLEETFDIKAPEDIRDRSFRRNVALLLGRQLCEGNQIDQLVNGKNIFPAMLKAIEEARHHIHLETFIYWSGEVGRTFADALIRKAQQSVEVRVLIDWFGSSRLDDSLIESMREGGVRFESYHRLRWLFPHTLGKVSHRTHRKLLIVDGIIGFIGGVGIADVWAGDARAPEEWRDSHFRVRGPVVRQLQATFFYNWRLITQEVVATDPYFPAETSIGHMDAHLFASTPREGCEAVKLMFLLALTMAKESIAICTPYFVPDRVLVRRLIAAHKRGVSVRILVPGKHIDHSIVRFGSRHLWGELLKEGILIFEYQPTMIHHKAIIVDRHWVSIGSANMDQRSLHWNDEANLNVFDDDLANSLIEQFEKDLTEAKLCSYEDWRHRPLSMKVMDLLVYRLRRFL